MLTEFTNEKLNIYYTTFHISIKKEKDEMIFLKF